MAKCFCYLILANLSVVCIAADEGTTNRIASVRKAGWDVTAESHEKGLMMNSPQVLKGFGGVYLVPVDISQDLVDAGLDKGLLQASLEARLRANGIRVIEMGKDKIVGWFVCINISVTGVPVNDSKSAFALSFSISAQTAAKLAPDPQNLLLNAMIWSKGATMFVGRTRVQSSVSDSMRAVMDDFSNDFLKANPK